MKAWETLEVKAADFRNLKQHKKILLKTAKIHKIFSLTPDQFKFFTWPILFLGGDILPVVFTNFQTMRQIQWKYFFIVLQALKKKRRTCLFIELPWKVDMPVEMRVYSRSSTVHIYWQISLLTASSTVTWFWK